MKVYQITDPEFAKYGRIISGYDFSGLIRKLKELPMSDGVTYVAADPALESLPVFKEFQEGFYGEIPAELGYCLGHNDALNGLEYHRNSEINVAVTDLVLLIGHQQDIEKDFT